MNERIKEIRKQSKLNQTDFGSKISLSKNFVWMLEAGERIPSDRTIKDICREFHINEEWLRTGDGDMYEAVEDEIGALVSEMIDNKDSDFYKAVLAFMKAYEELDPKSKQVIDNMIKTMRSNND